MGTKLSSRSTSRGSLDHAPASTVARWVKVSRSLRHCSPGFSPSPISAIAPARTRLLLQAARALPVALLLERGLDTGLQAMPCHDSSVRADRAGRLQQVVASFLAAIALGVLVVLAIHADAAAPHANPGLTTLDLATGLAFVIAAVVARGSSAERLLMAVVGVAWLTASFLPA